jgi:hypothetical protein
MDNNWRLAFQLDARGGDLDGLERALAASRGTIQGIVGDAHVRMGVTDRHPDLEAIQDRRKTLHRGVDGAIEVTVGPARAAALAAIAGALRDVISGFSAPSSVELTAGPIYPMVPVRDGETFLSLAFRRYPGTTSQQFRDWWRYQHAPLCIPILGEAMLAYDQVHVDPDATQAVCAAFGAAPTPYDAYDNLTWADPKGFLKSVSDADAMQRIFADEQGRIDDASRRHTLMRRIG